MSEKDIKTKPTSSPKTTSKAPKIAVKGKETVKNTVRDMKDVAKDVAIKNAIKTKENYIDQNGQEQPQRADNYATDSVENAAYTTADTAYHKSKSFVQNRIKEHNNKVKTREAETPEAPEPQQNEPDVQPDEPNAPKTAENEPKTAENYYNKETTPQADKKAEQSKTTVKTKEEYLKSQRTDVSEQGVKTKESYIEGQRSTDSRIKGVKDKSVIENTPTKSSATLSPKDARKEYVADKLKTKANYEKQQTENALHSESSSLKANDKTVDVSEKSDLPIEKSQLKTKDSYMQSLKAERTEPIKTPYDRAPKQKQAQTVRRSTTNSKKALKTRENVVGKSKSIVKSGNAHAKRTTKKATSKATKQAVKTQKEVTKKAAKQAAIRAKQAAIKAAQMAKVAAIKTAKVVAAIGKAIGAAIAKAGAAFFAAFGWIGVVVVLVILIVVIIVAAIAGSPFGIFISEEAADANSIPISSIINECNIELSQKLTDIEDNTTHDRIVMEGEQADWNLVLSIFSVDVAGKSDDTVQDVVVIDDAKKQKLKDTFWDMHSITSRTETVTSGETSETVLYITITAKTKDEMISEYGFNDKQKEALETLLENADGFVGSMQSLAISDATAQEVIDSLPDSLSVERKQVVKNACSLVGKVTYFWGGKSSAIGWDSEWGKMKLVTAEGSRSTGCMRPFGLDCSGFVTWSFINSGFSASAIGHGAATQASKGTRVSWSSAQPGDLAVYDDESHIGIIAGKDASGNTLVIHCSSGANNVVITTGGFGYAVRPSCY